MQSDVDLKSGKWNARDIYGPVCCERYLRWRGSYEPQTNLLHARKSWFTVRIGTCTNIDREEFY